ncbi:MAG: hypothetical protein QT00_C0002G0374 [archaeon GW2011_AR5]|nr:MAG: hypothetical protein QT00_C0002G0374 [archaeon GW2011_AR5]
MPALQLRGHLWLLRSEEPYPRPQNGRLWPSIKFRSAPVAYHVRIRFASRATGMSRPFLLLAEHVRLYTHVQPGLSIAVDSASCTVQILQAYWQALFSYNLEVFVLSFESLITMMPVFINLTFIFFLHSSGMDLVMGRIDGNDKVQ